MVVLPFPFVHICKLVYMMCCSTNRPSTGLSKLELDQMADLLHKYMPINIEEASMLVFILDIYFLSIIFCIFLPVSCFSIENILSWYFLFFVHFVVLEL